LLVSFLISIKKCLQDRGLTHYLSCTLRGGRA